MRIRALLAPLSIVAFAACGTDPAVKYAARGDLAALHENLDARAAKGNLDADTIRDVSKALLALDMSHFTGSDGADRMESIGSCAAPMVDALGRASESEDDVGAAAAHVLVSGGLVDIDTFTDAHRDDRHVRWLAVATRGLVTSEDASLRTERANADDALVRRAAIDAAADAGCASDFPLLLNAAKHDPVAIVRVDAVRGLARLADRLDSDALKAELVDRLVELWKGGDEALRGAIARAWGAEPLYGNGGLRELQVVIGDSEDHVAVEAAWAMMNAGSAEGEARLATLATKADEATRTHAIRLLDPKRPAHLDVLVQVMQANGNGPDQSVDREVAAEAISRIPSKIALPKSGDVDARALAVTTLKELATRKDRVGTEAAIALAESGDASMRDRLLEELKTPSPMRVRVATALVRLGHPEDVRSLLVDADLDLRDGVACAVLSAK